MIKKVLLALLTLTLNFQVYALDLPTENITKSQLKDSLTLLKQINKISESEYQATVKKIDSMSDTEFKKFLKEAGNFISDPKNVDKVKKQYGL